MPISKETFDSSKSFTNPKLLDFFIKNKNNAYSVAELKQKFGDVSFDLMMLSLSGNLEAKHLQDDYYYQLKPKK